MLQPETKLQPANNVLFEELCVVLDQLHKKKLAKDKEKILHKYIIDFKCNVAKEKGAKNTTFYPILRLLVPSYERERGAYNLKEQKLGELLVKVLALDKKSRDGQKLLNRSLHSQDGDFGTIAYFVLKSRVSQKTCNLTVGDVNEILDKIASAEVGNKSAILDDLFCKIIRNLTPEQTKWFLRIILKDLKVGMSAKRILSCFHPDAPEHYENIGNLAKVCEELEDGNVRPLELGIELFYAVSPMLSERLNIAEIADLPKNKTYQIEEKFDGERFQIHMQAKSDEIGALSHEYEYFSRKGFAYSSKYGKNYESGLLTPQLKKSFSALVTSFVLDGEMMGWHKERQCFGSKGMAFDVKKLTDTSRFQPCFVAFDLLYYNGRSLVGPEEKGGMKLSERLKLLDTLFEDVPGVIYHSERKMVTQTSDILQALNKAIDNQEEGIVVKDIESFYIANKRNAGWYKIKPEYTDGVIDDLDLVIIGIDAAENKRQGLAKSFLVAVLEGVNSESGEPAQRWVCVGRVATGLTFDQRESLCTLLQRHWQLASAQPPPPALVFNKIKPDFWILPEHSVVLQVRATELIRNRDFGTPYTLRFPRIKRLRDDKLVKDVMTLKELNKLVEDAGAGSVVKLSNKRIGDELIEGTEAKTRRKRPANLPQVPDELKKTTAGDVEVISQALKGKKICIVSDDEDCKRDDLIRIVESHGGKVVANPGKDTWVCIVGRPNVRARNLISQGENDVASSAWLRALPPSPTPHSLAPLDLITMKRETKLACAREYDEFGDSYTEPSTEETLRRCFKKMGETEPEVYLTDSEMLEVDQLLFGECNPYSFLRPYCIYMTSKSDNVLALQAQMVGATICDTADKNLTVVVAPAEIIPTKLREIKDQLPQKVNVVSEAWLQQCLAQKKIASVADFLI